MKNIKTPDWIRFVGFYSLASLIFASLYIVLYILIPSILISLLFITNFAYPIIVFLLSSLLIFLSLFPYLINTRGLNIVLLLFGAGIAVVISTACLYFAWAPVTIFSSVNISITMMELYTLSIRYLCVFFIGFGFSTIIRYVKDVSLPTQIILGSLFGMLFLLGMWGLSKNAFWNAELFATMTSEGTPNWSGQVFWLPITLLFPGCVLGCSITVIISKVIKRYSKLQFPNSQEFEKRINLD